MIEKLLDIMSKLRDPETGCPWDLEQDFRSIVPHTLEEAYEVAETIESGNLGELKNELGDLLFQIVFYAQLGKEQQRFDFAQIVDAICDKLVRRHPHVFGDAEFESASAQTQNWEQLKAQERQAKQGDSKDDSVLADVPHALPSLSRAQKIQARVARVGFDWPDEQGVYDKINEELNEVQQAWTDKHHRQEELGDLLFACVNLVRHAGLNAEAVLRQANQKFERRFRKVEQTLQQQGSDVQSSRLDDLERLWQQVKQT